eukprot:scaffold442_cov110-Cylindrotheca_fusiformis.AAC.17
MATANQHSSNWRMFFEDSQDSLDTLLSSSDKLLQSSGSSHLSIRSDSFDDQDDELRTLRLVEDFGDDEDSNPETPVWSSYDDDSRPVEVGGDDISTDQLLSSFFQNLPKDEDAMQEIKSSLPFEESFVDPELELRQLCPPVTANVMEIETAPSLGIIPALPWESLLQKQAPTLPPSDPIQCDITQSSSKKNIAKTSVGSKRGSQQSFSPLPRGRKRQRTTTTFDDRKDHRIREKNDALWLVQYQKLLNFKYYHGHCSIPIKFPEDPVLARWVKRQRYEFKRRADGKPSGINASRIRLLENIGFVWKVHSTAWQERFNELFTFWKTEGHCNVPSYFPENPQLSTWVISQRRHYNRHLAGKQSCITLERIALLDSLGFNTFCKTGTEAKTETTRDKSLDPKSKHPVRISEDSHARMGPDVECGAMMRANFAES